MNAVTVAALIQSVIPLGVFVFQVALVAGAPWGEYAMGGQHPGKLPIQLRVSSGVSALIMLAQSGHFLAQAGVIAPLLDPTWNTVTNWFWFAFTVIGLVLNGISRSKKERNLWVPVLAVSTVCTFIVAMWH
jgi:hypothetical protein